MCMYIACKYRGQKDLAAIEEAEMDLTRCAVGRRAAGYRNKVEEA